ncbi:DUF1653 domain-containing protein [Pseudomaricurvus sp.]|uniref:DUF1653 domain-containing protein n=1 Tax=Pseudomaricurvus sp. TaxID=2004510 RepID=UPI003F6AEA9E
MGELKAGVYRHYKGQDYQIFEVARHSETEEPLVVYRCLYGDYSWWVRPLTMFQETVTIEDEVIPRFEYAGAFDSTKYPQAPAREFMA